MKKLITLLCLLCSAVIFATGACPVARGSDKIEITNDNGLYIIRIPKERNANIRPYVTKSLTFNKDVFEKTGAEMVINAGYFDPNNKKTSSYVIVDKKVVLDPTTNQSLMNNASVKPYLNLVLNRTEFRVLDCHGKTKYDIAAHNAKAPFMCEIKHSIQAGPMIYPDLRLSREYFVMKDENGNVTCVHCTYDPETFGGDSPDGRKVKGTIHWVSATDNVKAEVRLYERLFNVPNPSDEEGVSSFEDNLNPDSLKTVTAYCEKSLANAEPGDRFQFMRNGYFCVDKNSTKENLIFNRTVQLRDSFNTKK